MPKQKTSKTVAKRIKITGSGKIRRNRPGRRHLLSGKSADTKRKLRKSAIITGALAKMFKKSLG